MRGLEPLGRRRGATAVRWAAARLRGSAEAFERAFDDAPIGMTLNSVDAADAGRILRANAAAGRMFAVAPEALVGMLPQQLVHPDDLGLGAEDWQRLLAGELPAMYHERRFLRPAGGVFWALNGTSLVRDVDGRVRYAISQLQDITHRREADRRLREIEGRLRATERAARRSAERRLAQQTAVAWLGQQALEQHDADSLYDAAVNVVAATLGASHAALIAREPDGSLRRRAAAGTEPGPAVPAGDAASQAGFVLATGGPVVSDDLSVEDRYDVSRLAALGVVSSVAVVVAGAGDEPLGVLSAHALEPRAFSTDDTAFLASIANVLTGGVRRAAAARDLRHQSLHDPLTKLPNRALLLDRLHQGLARGRRDGTTLAVLFCDMDDFKTVNDTLGHDAGDRLLARLAPRLRDALRATDTLARFGGDEFVALCEGIGEPAEVLAVAERLLAAFAAPVDLGGAEFVPTASIGIALAPPGTESDPEALLRDADVAMYGAKNGGKGRFELFDARMRARALDRVRLLSDLRHAVRRGQLELAFQPVVSLRGAQIAGLEALVRWRHPERGLLMPDAFVGLAEDNGLIGEVGRWVIDEAVRRAVAWRRARTPVLHDAMVGVNVSWRQLSQGDLAADVAAILAEHGLDGRRLCLEVTESALMDDAARSRRTLVELRDLGVHLALDDFGKGQSSLWVLRGFPLHTIKLDRAFLSGGEWAIVRAVCEMARSMDLLVVAEGVEHADQAARARELGCDFGQGWLYCAAVGQDEIGASAIALQRALDRGGVA